MTTWVASSYWSAWVADCGPYLGPLPLPPPDPAALGVYGTVGEVDYYITEASAADVVAGTDAPPNEGSYRYWDSPTTTSSNTYGGLVTGAPHLFVFVYDPTFTWPTSAPSMDALTLVPSSMAAGGTLVVDPFQWTDCTGAPSYFHAFACDMGPYIGPWPLLPPGVIDGLPAGDEVDFYVALPNPTDPTDVTLVADGSYDTAIWDSWRYANTGTPPPDTFFGYSGDYTGPSSPFPIPSSMPAGAHLYVAAFTPSAPVNPPEFYVPASYAAGGVAAFETSMGHWSGDQAGFSQTDSISASVAPAIYTYPTDHTYAGDHNIVSAVSAQITEILAATPTVGSSSIGIEARKTHTTVPSVFETRVQLTANIHVATYDGTAYVDSDTPPALFALVFDADYSDTPYIDADGNAGKSYQYDSAPTWAWQSGAADGFLYEDYDENVSTGESLPFGITLRAQWVSGTIAGTPPWTVSGGSLGDIVGPAVLGSVYAVDYSPVTDLHFTLHAVETLLYTGAITGLTDMAMVSGNREFNDGSLFGPSTPDLAIDRSTWQYWVPGDIVPTTPKWHTIAGSWASISGAPMAIFTPGLGPVDYADGPA